MTKSCDNESAIDLAVEDSVFDSFTQGLETPSVSLELSDSEILPRWRTLLASLEVREDFAHNSRAIARSVSSLTPLMPLL
ncbi:hypothetical protein POG22_07505 [Geitlerinema sp. CS-897]|nr:hypothetical protein [Geitlerinema sp. CS-897]